MTGNRRVDNILYKIGDFIAAVVVWGIFFVLRRRVEGGDIEFYDLIKDPVFFYGILAVPAAWQLFYFIFDKREDVYRLSRLSVFIRTAFLSFFGVLIIYFTILQDDLALETWGALRAFLILFLLHFVFTVLFRMVLLTGTSKKLKAGRVGFRTLLVGGGKEAVELYMDLDQREKKLGHKFIGYISTNGNSSPSEKSFIPHLGRLEDLRKIIYTLGIEEVIIAIPKEESEKLNRILDVLFEFNEEVLVKVLPNMYDIMLGNVKMNHVYGAVLIEVKQGLMARWQRILKRIIDVVVSILALVIFFPLLLYLAVRVKMSSGGGILFKQERIGQFGIPFTLYKFRSMYEGAEKDGPQLSHDSDERCTPVGAMMRKWRLDELPNFLNVLKGDLSLVGPRPERAYYIEKIMKVAPYYRHLLKIRPGITSWGQVKYGYASNVEEMLQRLKYDIVYLENMSLALDFKIIFYTLVVLFQGKGK